MVVSAQDVIKLAHSIATGELGRLTSTVLVIFAGFIIYRGGDGLINRGSSTSTAENKLTRRILLRNSLLVLCVLAIVTIWASKIAGFALSVAAVAGAIMLVSKEVLMCILGHLMMAVSRPFRVGDWVEIGPYRGQVIDTEIFSTKLAETSTANQTTGATISVPNSMMLTTPVRNYSSTGNYMVVIQEIRVPFDVDFDAAEIAALQAAGESTAQWQESANKNFERIESSELIELPSAKPKVLWDSADSKSYTLGIRFASPVDLRVATEQKVFRLFWKYYREKTKG